MDPDTESEADDDDTSSSSNDHDGFRPSPLEIRQSSSLHRRKSTAGTSALDASVSRTPSNLLARLRSRPAVPAFTHPLAHTPTTASVIVDFDGPSDPYQPRNWPMSKKVLTTLLYSLVTMSASWASSCFAPGTEQVAEHFHVGRQVSVLGTSLFLVGFGIGPLLWAPVSEVYGRRMAVFGPMFVATCFSFAAATAKDFQTLMLTRFFGAFFASAPVTNTGGVLGDLFGPEERGIAMAGYAIAVVGGPSLGESPFHYLTSLQATTNTLIQAPSSPPPSSPSPPSAGAGPNTSPASSKPSSSSSPSSSSTSPTRPSSSSTRPAACASRPATGPSTPASRSGTSVSPPSPASSSSAPSSSCSPPSASSSPSTLASATASCTCSLALSPSSSTRGGGGRRFARRYRSFASLLDR